MNRHSAEWMALKKTIAAEIERLRDQLEQPGFEPGETRGAIIGLRWLIKQVEPDAPITEPTGTDYSRITPQG